MFRPSVTGHKDVSIRFMPYGVTGVRLWERIQPSIRIGTDFTGFALSHDQEFPDIPRDLARRALSQCMPKPIDPWDQIYLGISNERSRRDFLSDSANATSRAWRMLAYPLPGTFLLLVSQWWSRVGTIDRGGDARMTVDPAPPPFPDIQVRNREVANCALGDKSLSRPARNKTASACSFCAVSWKRLLRNNSRRLNP
jgi:hypothetical protein